MKKIEKIFKIDNKKFNEELQSVIVKNNLHVDMSAFFETETHLHIKNVADIATIIAKEMGLNKEEISVIKQIAPLHDIGKLLIPAKILTKPAKLTKAEFDVIKSHANIGYELLKDCNSKILQLAALVAIQHHEKYDGTGYPFGLKNREIHLYSKIITLADVVESLSAERCYKKAWKKEDIKTFIKEQKAKQFDPTVVAAALKQFNKFFN